QRDPLLRVGGERRARLPELPQPLRPKPAQRDEAGERKQRLVRRHVRRRLLATDVLLARLEREDEAAPALEVARLADDPPRHAADELLPRGKEAVVRAAVRLVVPDRLPFADRHGAAVVARRLEQAERGEVDVRDGEGAGRGRGGGEVRGGLEAAERVRLLEDDGGGVDRRGRER